MVLIIRNKATKRLTLYFGMDLDVDPMPISESIFTKIRMDHFDQGYKTDMFGVCIDGGNTPAIDALLGEMIERGYEFQFVDEENNGTKYSITFETSEWKELYDWVETL